MLKRLIEVALPLKEVSEQSAREKSIRHGHISTLHIWWARRPLAACRAAVFASLIPDPDDPECPESFRNLVRELLGPGDYKERFSPRDIYGAAIPDTPRNRCLEFVKHLVKWENSNNPDFIEPARKLIVKAHKFLHPTSQAAAPQVLDPFTGGGAIPLEMLRLGCGTFAVDINPVAHLIELCTLVYPQKYGQRDSRPVPDYIKKLVARNRVKKASRDGKGLFEDEEDLVARGDESTPCVHITEAEYRKNPLAAEVKYWGFWIHKQAVEQIGRLFPPDNNGNRPIAYMWARTATCPNPACGASIPLVRQTWLAKKAKRAIALRVVPDHKGKCCRFDIVENKGIDFHPAEGTMRQGKATCPFCSTVADGAYLRQQACRGKMGTQLMAVVAKALDGGKVYRSATANDEIAIETAEAFVNEVGSQMSFGTVQWKPTEPVPGERPAPNSRGLSGVHRYGADQFYKLFSTRQLAGLICFGRLVRTARAAICRVHDDAFADAVTTFLSFALSKLADRNSANCVWIPQTEALGHSFSRQALQMVWDFLEIDPLDAAWGWLQAFGEFHDNIMNLSAVSKDSALTRQASAAALPFERQFDAIVTDPPYYESVPYGDLSDFFYVWLRRCVGDVHSEVMRSPLTPKGLEIIAYYGSGKRKVQKPPAWYEEQMGVAFREMRRVLSHNALAVVMFAHKTTSAWETLISALLAQGLTVTASWPIHTERMARMVAQGTASLAGSISLVCRPRLEAAEGLWDDVRQELKAVSQERLDFFWNQGIRGADFFISAIGPALSVFGKYQRVTKLSGEEVTVGQFLDEVRSLVSNFALTKILKTSHTGTIDRESRFYVVWKWSYADAKVAADESFKLSQALGLDTDRLWDKTGVLEKSGENVQATPVAKRMKIKNLGEPTGDGAPASLIDILHRMCAFREEGDTHGMGEFLGRSGHANNHSLWLVAQAVSEILPDGDKEKQLMQGLLNQKESLEEAMRQGKLF